MSNVTPPNDPVANLTPAGLQAQANDLFFSSFAWLRTHWLEIGIALGVAALIVLLLHGARRWGMKLCERSPGITGWGTILGRVIARTGNFFMVMVAARLVLGYAYAPPAVFRTVEFLFTIAAAFQVALWVRELILSFVEYRTESEEYRGEALSSAVGIIRLLVTVALFAIAFVVVLSNLGVNVTGLVAGLGIGGIAIGLAAQGIFADLFAALAIIFDKPFRRGENISYDTTSGTIEAIGLKSTRIRSFTGEMRIISNKNLLDKEIQNITRRDHMRIQFMLGLAYETPPEKLEKVPALVRAIVEEQGAVAVRAGFASFAASTLDYEVIFDVPGDDWNVGHATRDKVALAILRRFKEEEIAFAYPSQTTFTAAPDGTLIMPYPQVQPVLRVDKDPGEDRPPSPS